jgi:hypothetical protein
MISAFTVGLILIIFYVVVGRKIYEWWIWKDVEVNGHGLFWYYRSM